MYKKSNIHYVCTVHVCISNIKQQYFFIFFLVQRRSIPQHSVYIHTSATNATNGMRHALLGRCSSHILLELSFSFPHAKDLILQYYTDHDRIFLFHKKINQSILPFNISKANLFRK